MSIALLDNQQAILRQANAYELWCSLRSFQAFPVLATPLCAYLVHRVDRLAGSTKSVRGVISRLRVHSVATSNPWLDPSESRRLECLVSRLEFLDLKPTKRAKPATSPLITVLTNNQMIHPLLRLMFATAHDGLLRGAEICGALQVKDFDWSHDCDSVTLHLHRSKCCRKGGGEFVQLVNYKPNCAADLLRQYFEYYHLWQKSEAFVFPRLRGNEIDPQHNMSVSSFRSAFRSALKLSGIESHGYGTHSFRAGGATDLFKAGVSYPNIKKFGRWKSEAALLYYRDSDAVVSEVFAGFKRLSTQT